MTAEELLLSDSMLSLLYQSTATTLLVGAIAVTVFLIKIPHSKSRSTKSRKEG